MRHITICFILIISISVYSSVSGSVALCQPAAGETPRVLEKLFSRMISNSADSNRIRINDSIRTIIDKYVFSDTLFKHNFTNLRYLGQITSPDSLLKIITWNLVLRSSPNRYFCYFIRNSVGGNGNRVYRLESVYKEEPVVTDTTYSENNWYGALYYDIRDIFVNGIQYWILLGIDYGNPLISRKIIEVMSLNKDGSLVFGKKWFVSGEEIKFRDVFEYASNGLMSLRFGTGNSIIFDHLVPFSPSLKDDRQYYGPDYSYDSYFFEKGFWKLIINVDARNKE